MTPLQNTLQRNFRKGNTILAMGLGLFACLLAYGCQAKLQEIPIQYASSEEKEREEKSDHVAALVDQPLATDEKSTSKSPAPLPSAQKAETHAGTDGSLFANLYSNAEAYLSSFFRKRSDAPTQEDQGSSPNSAYSEHGNDPAYILREPLSEQDVLGGRGNPQQDSPSPLAEQTTLPPPATPPSQTGEEESPKWQKLTLWSQSAGNFFQNLFSSKEREVAKGVVSDKPPQQTPSHSEEPRVVNPHMEEADIAREAVEGVGQDSGKESLPWENTATAGRVTGYYIQLGSFSKRENAEKMENQLKGLNIPFLRQSGSVNEEFVYRVYSGPFASQGEAKAMVGLLHERKIEVGRITQQLDW